MASSNPQTITIRGCPTIKEGPAKAALSPGHLVETVGVENQEGYQKSTLSTASVPTSIALENDLVGKTIANAYEVNENVRVGVFGKGMRAYVRVSGGATSIALGDTLKADGDGTVAKATAGSAVIGTAMQAVDNSSGTDEVFIKMEIA